MKKVVYNSLIAILWAVIHVLIGVILIIVGVVEASSPNALLVAVLIPEVWILSIGLAMFSRRELSKRILHEEKKFSKVVPIVLVALGGLMVGANILLTCIQRCTTNDTTQTVSQKVVDTKEVSSNSTETYKSESSNVDLSLTKTIMDFKAELNEEFEKMSKRAPIRINEVMTLNEIKNSESTYNFIYRLEINKDDIAENELKDIIEDFGENNKIELYYEAISMCALAEIDSNEFFKAVNIRLQYIFTDANNSNIGNCEVDYKDFAKE